MFDYTVSILPISLVFSHFCYLLMSCGLLLLGPSAKIRRGEDVACRPQVPLDGGASSKGETETAGRGLVDNTVSVYVSPQHSPGES